MKVYCRECKRKTKHEELIPPYEQKASTYDEFQWIEKYYIVKCKGCETVAFVLKYGDEDTWEENPFGEREFTYKYTVYPLEPLSQHESKKFIGVPKFIQDLYIEIVRAFNSNSIILCSIGLRVIIEAICKEKGIERVFLKNKDGSPKIDEETQENKFRFLKLSEKLDILLEQRYITNVQSRVLHQIRELGNKAAHEITKHDRRNIDIGLEIIENMLYNIYELENIDF